MRHRGVAPSKGLAVTEHTFVSAPDGNTVNIRFIRPDGDDVLPCVYYIHGGGMATMSCYDGNYRAWGRIIAAQGVAVAMVDFRNALRAVVGAGGRALSRRAERLRVGDQVGGRQPRRARHRPRADHRRRRERRRQPHPRHRAAPEHATATSASSVASTRCAPTSPAIWPLPENPSSTENNGILLDLHNNRGAMAYGIEELDARNPLAWPGFATEDDVAGSRRR